MQRWAIEPQVDSLEYRAQRQEFRFKVVNKLCTPEVTWSQLDLLGPTWIHSYSLGSNGPQGLPETRPHIGPHGSSIAKLHLIADGWLQYADRNHQDNMIHHTLAQTCQQKLQLNNLTCITCHLPTNLPLPLKKLSH